MAITEERLGQEIWADLQSNVQERIHGALLMLSEREKQIALIDLVRMVATPNQYSVTERISVGKALSFLGDPRIRTFEPMLARVPAGAFTMGTATDAVDQILEEADAGDTDEEALHRTARGAVLMETPERTIELPAFLIGRFLVTNSEFHSFVLSGGAPPRDYWEGTTIDPWLQNRPVQGVTWEEAVGYCDWLANETGRPFRLPTEEEWEKAARGTDGRLFPWGDSFQYTCANVWEGGVAAPTPVGVYPDGVSPYGVLDMAGNVAEWTASFIGTYPDSAGSEVIASQVEEYGRYRVVRGGCWRDPKQNARCASRGYPGGYHTQAIGFRVALDASV
ncbi:MAG: formylglycine-generating enzyme family protein [Chloroflexi bacterium]|nr:formylglycine-generating enzyme family protein [Chloroflexota bacterium]